MKWPTKHEQFAKLAENLIELVAGRRDVAARYFEFERDGKTHKGWSPWKGRTVDADYTPLPGQVVREFKNHKNGQLERRILEPLNTENVVKHLRGVERLGVYVLDPSAHVKFLAADFDDHGGALQDNEVLEEAARFAESADVYDFTTALERSKSGTGYHVWMFFEEPVPAVEARALGKWLMEESQTLREDDDFSTFDRFFPAQAAVPPAGKGFGNLIGLPMCGGEAYQAGRTAWVTAYGDLVEDPAGYVAELLKTRNPLSRIRSHMEAFGISLEPVDAGEYKPRDPDQPVGTPEEFEAVRSRCAFLRWAADPANQPNIREPMWFSMISNMARFDVRDAIHQASSSHGGYDPVDTDQKIDHARQSGGPHRCKTIQEEGFTGCPAGGCKLPSGNATRAPAGLSAWAQAQGSGGEVDVGPSRSRAVNVEAPAPDNDDPEPWGLHDELPVYEETGLPWPPIKGHYEMSSAGLKDGNGHICMKPLWVDALTRNNRGEWGVSLKFFDFDYKLRTHAFPRERLHEQGGVLGRELAAYGLPIMPGKEKMISRYLVIHEGFCQRRIRAATRIGWFDAPESPGVFILPNQVLGKAPEEIVYQPEFPIRESDTIYSQGALKEWQKSVADLCKGNPLFMFSLMLGLAGPLLKLCQEQSGGFHIYGVTTTGKTTAAQIATSVWGCAADPQEGPQVTAIRKWYTTSSALESVAELHNDMVLALDEIGEVDVQELGRMIYQLAGGLSKGRANASGGMRFQRTWRLLFVSTGEKSIRQMLGQVGQTAKGGQRVRMPDIPTDSDSSDSAIVQDSHGMEAAEFVSSIKAACSRHFGIAGPVFAGYLCAQVDSLGMAQVSAQLRDELAKFVDVLSRKNPLQEDGNELVDMPPEGRRLLRRFALVALAGARAHQAGVISWTVPEILEAVIHVRDRWLSELGEGKSEIDRGLAHFRSELVRSWNSFADYDGGGRSKSGETLGFKARDCLIMDDEALARLCGEFDIRAILRRLDEDGFLWHDKNRLKRKCPPIPALNNTRPYMYWIRLDFIGEVDNTYQHQQRGEDHSDLLNGAGPPSDDIPF